MEMTMAEKIKPVEKVDELTPAQQIERHKSQIAEIAATIKEEAREKETRLSPEKVKMIDLNYIFSEESEKPTQSKKGEQTGPCTICKFMTNPPHGGRSHKSQTVKAPFTDEELKSKALVKVSSSLAPPEMAGVCHATYLLVKSNHVRSPAYWQSGVAQPPQPMTTYALLKRRKGPILTYPWPTTRLPELMRYTLLGFFGP